jgi:pimeloyl-ACP methyl ester carboxylesterase
MSSTSLKLILLPGLDGTGLLFQPLLEQLDANWQVQIINYPSDQCQSIQELAEQVRQQVVFDTQTVLLAESFSGLVAIELLRQGIPLHSIIFCASFASSPRPWLLKLVDILPLSPLFRLPLPERLLCLAGQNALTAKLIRQARQQVSPAVLAHRLRLIAAAQSDPPEQPWDILCHYLQAADDWLVPARCAEELREYFTAVTVTRIAGSGHFLLQTQPAACATVIGQALQTHDRTSKCT